MTISDIDGKYRFYHNYELVKYFSDYFKLDVNFENKTFEYEDDLLLFKNILTYEVKIIIGKFLFKQICEGILYLHNKEIAHRDIKPNNIVFKKSHNSCKLIDFSISCLNKSLTNEPGGSIEFQGKNILN
jgi:serine/threonine protein kinase